MRRTGNSIVRPVGLALTIALVSTGALAAPLLEAEVTPSRVAPGQQATYMLTVTGGAGGQLVPPDFGELRVSGPSQTTQSLMTFSGGRQMVRTSQVYSWRVEASRPGTYRIGPASLGYHGDVIVADAVELVVDTAFSPPPSAQPRRSRPSSPFFADDSLDPFDGMDPFDMLDQFTGGSARGRRSPAEHDVFLRAFVDKTEAWMGEQITMTLYLFSQAEVSTVQNIAFPKLDGFWAEDIDAPTNLVPEVRHIKGRPYRAYMLRRKALFPLRAGELTVDPVQAQLGLGLGLFWGAQPENVERRSAPVKLRIKPLPAAGQPPRFQSSNVGTFTLGVTQSGDTVELGQPIQVEVKLEGHGNVKGARVPSFTLPAGLKSYDPTITDKVRIRRGRVGGTKSLEWVIVPERTGHFELPPIEFPYFDPEKGQYRVARTEPVSFTVTAPAGGPPVVDGSGTAAPRSVANVLSGGLRPVRIDPVLGAGAPSFVWQRPYFWPLTAGPVAAWLVMAAALGLVRIWRGRDPEKLRERRARGVAGKRLQGAKKFLEAGDAAAFYGEVARALLQFVIDRSGVEARGYTHEALGSALVERGAGRADAQALIEVLEICSAGRFAPMAEDRSRMREVFEKATGVIDALNTTRWNGRRS